MALCLFANAAYSADFTTIFAFQSGEMPAGPRGPMINGPNGILYGAGDGYGGVFQLTPPATSGGAWTETTLTDDYVYGAPVALGPNGDLYGIASHTTMQDVFSLTPPASPGAWIETVLYTFPACSAAIDRTECPDGYGIAQLAVGPDGTVYGIAAHGGKYGRGTIFALTPPSAPGGAWTDTVLYNFTGHPDGAQPSGLTLGSDGTLYITASGGRMGKGGIFALTPPALPGGAWTEKALYSFKGSPDGMSPAGAVTIGSDGTLYGVTTFGGYQERGTVFQVKPPESSEESWKESVLHRFKNFTDGKRPSAGLALGSAGEIYGATSRGGESAGDCKRSGCGTIFELIPPVSSGGAWTETLLETFPCGKSGCQPYGGLVASPDGAIYGTTTYGGSRGNGGTAFRIQP
jgi:uncharacterized repeat protein (TIGR03803 family)